MDPRPLLAWFDIFGWPLTGEDLRTYGPPSPRDSSTTDGFIHLPNRADLSWFRRRKSVWAWRKLRKARRWARVLACIPFVRMIAVVNALGYGNCRDASDIDLFIVTTPRRVWTTRLLVVACLRAFRQRPGEHARLNFFARNFGGHARDAICPSFFVTTEAMNLESLQLPSPSSSRAEPVQIAERFDRASRGISNDAPPDPYLLFWLTQLTVLFDRGGTYASCWRANEQWVRRWFPDARPRAVHPRLCSNAPPPLPPPPQGGGGTNKLSPPHTGRGSEPAQYQRVSFDAGRGWGSRLGDVLERLARRFQERRFPSTIRELANRDSRVVISDAVLKFHTDDRRAEYRQQWIDRLRI